MTKPSSKQFLVLARTLPLRRGQAESIGIWSQPGSTCCSDGGNWVEIGEFVPGSVWSWVLGFEAVVNDTSVGSAKGSAEKSPASGPDLESSNQVVPLKPQGLLKILPCGSGSHSHNG